MSKLILLFLLGYIVYRWLRSVSPIAEKKTKGESAEAMLLCARCGVHFPSSEAVREGEKVFCSKQHSL